MTNLHEDQYVTLTFVVRSTEYDPVDPDDPREMLADNEAIMFWAAENGVTPKAIDLGADLSSWHEDIDLPPTPFPQTQLDARTCQHGNVVWLGHECGICDEFGEYRWNDMRECLTLFEAHEPEVGDWYRCVTHNYQVLGDIYVCEGYTPPPYVERGPGAGYGEHLTDGLNYEEN